MIEIIAIVIIFGLFVLLITGLGILTGSVFSIKSDTTTVVVPAVTGTPNPGYLKYIQEREIDANYTKEQKAKDIASIPLTEGVKAAETLEVPNGQNLIELSGANLAVAKISLISFWIFTIVGIFYGTYKILFKF
jgi:hypothetical protein